MKYKVRVRKNVTKKLRKLPKSYVSKIYSTLKGLAENPRPNNSKKLQGNTETYRLRVGVYRVIYTIDDIIKIVDVKKLMHRQEGY